MTQIFPVLLYLAEMFLQLDKFCLLLALKDLPVRVILSKVDHCSLLYGAIDCKVKSQLQVILKPAEFLTAEKIKPQKWKNKAGTASHLLSCPLQVTKWRDFEILTFGPEALHDCPRPYILQ